ncbi:hypothetical protein NFI95_06015 [Acetobacteraceae bacterium KSS8]|uniref:Antitoxin n=1 Tax=Endosaccharibacter trunci TaxID=2812733 RepID=A0ABT1W551_9PROT|nr:hypothetical protein [Acetobacteraceae bacterium KSS8]
MKTTTIQFDERSQREIDKLKRVFSASTNAAVVRKALALAAVIAEEADENHQVAIRKRSREGDLYVSLAR